jgi:hypothetical protein
MLVFDRASVSIKRATIPDIPPIEYTVETFNLNTGDLLHKIRLASLVILGFWRHYVIAYRHDTITFHDLTKDGYAAKQFKHTRPEACRQFDHQLMFIRDSIMAIGSDSTVFFYDLNDDLLIRKINVIEKSGVPLLKGDKGQVGSLAFDDWKLVAVLFMKRFDYKRILFDTFVSIFDISKMRTTSIRCVNTIGTRLSCNRTWPVNILLPSNEKILINAKFSELTEIDFFHPNLCRNTIKIGNYKKGNKLQVETILPIDITEYAIKRFNTTLENITHVTYYLRDQLGEPTDKEGLKNHISTGKANILPSILDLRWQDKRITFVFQYFKGSAHPEPNTVIPWMNKKEFDSRWEIRDNILSAIHLTTTDPHLSQSHPHNSERLKSMVGEEFFILFEKFDPQTNQWLITEPFVPEGTALELFDM